MIRSPQLAAIERLAAARPDGVSILATVEGQPIHSFAFGTGKPVLLVVGGVHGLERIGCEVATAFLASFIQRLGWDRVLVDSLDHCRVIVVPLLNPVGMARSQRANGNGVDLMRNAPPHPLGGTPLLGGQQYSRRLPWYMGTPGVMEPESAALAGLVDRVVGDAPFAIALDCHSGYGFVDRLWYPYARTREPIPDAPAIAALSRLLDDTLPHHVYRLEQTAQAYTIRGDLWDFLYDRHRAGRVFLPLTLEMGSWTWVRKNPWQGFSQLGRFNPIEPHRHRRTLRRHVPLFEFLLHATISHQNWLNSVNPPYTPDRSR